MYTDNLNSTQLTELAALKTRFNTEATSRASAGITSAQAQQVARDQIESETSLGSGDINVTLAFSIWWHITLQGEPEAAATVNATGRLKMIGGAFSGLS